MAEEEQDIELRELIELNTTAAKEYEEAMLNRVEYFAKKNAEKSIFNNCRVVTFKKLKQNG